MERRLRAPETLRSGPSIEAQAVADLPAGEAFLMLDDSLGWAWGYAGDDRRVGYLRSDLLVKNEAV